MFGESAAIRSTGANNSAMERRRVAPERSGFDTAAGRTALKEFLIN
jgi:hypothetical protein